MALVNRKTDYLLPENNLIDRLNNSGFDTSKIRTLDGDGFQVELKKLFKKANTGIIFIQGKNLELKAYEVESGSILLRHYFERGPFGLIGIDDKTFGIITTNLGGFSLDNLLEFNIDYYKEIWGTNTTHFNEVRFQYAKKHKYETIIRIDPVTKMQYIPRK
ncbi:MAG: hypothetical protein KC589_05290 [Nanoarchaeota archaeon]|nr:hypothetical protein [Nanoarchaeota archaeon]